MVYGLYGAQVADCRSPSAEGSEAGYNARLIAAAPDMLSQLRETLRYLESLRALGERGVTGPTINARINELRDALRSVEV
jgi:hypothetical protein